MNLHVLHVLFPQDPLMISLSSTTSSPMAGESVSLTCSVTLPGAVNGSPVFQWVGPGDTPTPADPSTSGQMVTSTLTLSAVKTSQAGQYTCTASVPVEGPNRTVSIALRSVNITVLSKWKDAHWILHGAFLYIYYSHILLSSNPSCIHYHQSQCSSVCWNIIQSDM